MVAAVTAILAVPVMVKAQTVTTVSEFNAAIAGYATAAEDIVVEVNQNLTISSPVIIPSLATIGKTLTIRSTNPAAPVTLMRGVGGNLFTVSNNATLILENIIIDGDRNGDFENGDGSIVWINNGGELVMNNNAIVRNNFGGFSGGGVNVSGGTFTMHGGEINDNAVNKTNSSNNYSSCFGGGVYVGFNGTFIMFDGKISDNNAGGSGGGVFVVREGTFTMYGGEINKNTAHYSNNGGVSVGGSVRISSGTFSSTSGGTFTMNGGKISGNNGNGVEGYVGAITMHDGEISGNNGAGMYNQGGTFTMNRGKISDNTNNGVVASGCTFTMNGGEISGNGNTSTSGGGVHFSSYSNQAFTMNGGKISGNTAGGGGGAYFHSGTTFNMTGGEITGNSAHHGGGVYFTNGGTFTMIDGKISGNTVGYDGGGVYLNPSNLDPSEFSMLGGEITGNSAVRNGGGVYVTGGGTFTMIDGKISGNSAENDGSGVYINNTHPGIISKFDITGGVVVGTGTTVNNVVSGLYNLNNFVSSGIIIAWSKPNGVYPFVYTEDTDNDLTFAPSSASAVWARSGAKFGISYENGINANFIEIADVTVKHPTTIVAWPMSTAITYGAALSTSTLNGGSAIGVGNVDIIGSFTWNDGLEIPTVMNSGYSVIFTPDDENYETVMETVAIAVDKAILNIIANDDGVIYGNVAPVYTVSYSGFVNNETEVVLGGDLSLICAYTQDSNVGTYDIIPSGLTSDNYDIMFVKGTLTVEPKSLTATMLSIPTVTFNGIPQTPILIVTDQDLDAELVGNADYIVTLNSRTNAGTYAITVTGIGNYTGTAAVDFIINPKALTEEMLSIPAIVFNGTSQTPDLTAIDHDIGKMTRNIDYTVTLTPRTIAGTYPVTVTGIGNYTGTSFVNFVITDLVAVLSPNRVIPDNIDDGVAIIVPVSVLSSEFTAGPNPVARSSESVNFFCQGKWIQNASLTVFDASGNIINKVKITDNALNTQTRRIVGSWDLTDSKGRLVSVGTYLVRGVIITSDGKRERVSVMVGVR